MSPDQLHALYTLLTQIETLDTAEAVERLVSLLADALDAGQCTLVLRDETGDFVPQWPAVGLSEAQVRAVRWSAEEGQAFLEQVPLKQAAHLLPPPANPVSTLWQERELLVARIQFGDTLYGGLRAANKRQGTFTEEDARFLALAAQMVAHLIAHTHIARQRETMLREQQIILETVSDFVYAFRVDEDGTLHGEFVSPAFTRVFGFTLEEVHARGGWVTMLHPDDLEVARRHVARLLTNRPDVAEFRFLTREEEVRWLRDYAHPIWDEKAGRVVRIIGASRDITETRRKEQALRESEARYRALVEQSPFAIGIHQDGRVVFANRQAATLLGASSPDELLGLPIERIVHPETWPAARERIQRMLNGETGLYPVEDRYRRLDGSEVPVEVIATPLTYQGRPAIQVIARDLSAERRTRAQLERQQAHLEHLHHLSMALNATVDLNEVLQRFADEVLRISPVNRCSIWLKDPHRDVVVPHIFGDLPPHLRQADQVAVDSDAVPLVAEALQRREPLHVPDAAAPEMASLVPRAFRARYRIRSFLLVPLRTLDQAVGFLVLDDTRRRHVFAEDEIRTVESMAAVAAVAIHNARLYGEALRSAARWQALHQAAQQIVRAAQEPEAVYQAAHQAAARMFPTDAFVISLQQGEEIAAVYLWDAGRRWPEQRLPLDQGLSGYVLRHGRPVLISDVTQTPELLSHRFGAKQEVQSVLAVPMRLGEQVIGMLAVQSYRPDAYQEDDIPPLEMLAAHVAVALETARLFGREQQQRRRAEALTRIAATLTATLDEQQVIAQVLEQVGQVLPNTATNLMQIEGDTARVVAHRGYRELGLGEFMDRLQLPVSETPNLRTMLQTRRAIIIPDIRQDPDWINLTDASPLRSYAGAPLRTPEGVLGFLNVDALEPGAFRQEQADLLQAFADQAAIALQNARRYGEVQRRVTELESVRRASLQLTRSLNLKQVLGAILEQALALAQGDDAHIFLYDGQHLTFGAAMWGGQLQDHPISEPRPDGVTYRVARSGQPLFIQQAAEHELYADYQGAPGTMISLPLKIGERVVGVMNMAHERPRPLDAHERRALELLADQAAVAIENARLYTQTQEQLRRMEALHRIDMLISSAVDLQLTLGTLCDFLRSLLQVDAAAVLLYNPYLRALTCKALQGFRVTTAARLRGRLGEGLVGSLVLQPQPLVVNERDPLLQDPRLGTVAADERFAFYAAVPLISKGEVRGVIEVFHRRPKTTDADWLDFLETIAGQAAIAIDQAELFQELQRANQEIHLAYEATLEGWARALEFRDQETEGHSRRVVDLTLRLAEALGVPTSERVHIRRGALLHDIGKMGVPDHILLKAGPLTEEEWAIMREHPKYAYELLRHIPYLQPALDIPHYHHERWDGSGYPEGLKGNQIPLAARIFAVVDVWDALSSDRPYRPAWPPEKVAAYLRENAGKLFDPDIVDVFLQVLQEQGLV